MAMTRSQRKTVEERSVLEYHIDTLPSDVLEYQIFHYFWFNHWVTTFTAVCKRWKQICEHSKMAPKHIVLTSNKEFDIVEAVNIVTKYQPTILEIKCKPRSVPNFAFSKMISASKSLNTLILHHKSYMLSSYGKQRELRKDISRQITTLALHYQGNSDYDKTFNMSEVAHFPNLRRLHVRGYRFNLIKSTPVTEIIYESNEDDCMIFKATPDGWTSIVPNRINELSYEQYFRYVGETRLYSALKAKDYDKASVLLDTFTSMAYEDYLHQNCRYEFPTSLIITRNFDIWKYESKLLDRKKISKVLYDAFISTNKMQVSGSFKFLCLFQLGRIQDAIQVLKTMDPHSPINALSIEAFMQMLLLPEITKELLEQPNIIDVARRMVNEHDYTCKCLSRDFQFEKIAFLRNDWSDVDASLQNNALFWSMIRHGCRPRLAEIIKSNTGQFYLDQLGVDLKLHIFDVIVESSIDEALKLQAQHNIALDFEKDGQALVNALIRRGHDAFTDDNSKKLINHMDGSGCTLLIAAITSNSIKLVIRLLNMGADPNLSRGNQLSPLALVTTEFIDKSHPLEDAMSLIDLLLEYGADINAPCLFEQRMCSPLMIAVLKKRPIELIKLLITLGARVDYEDETGRLIVDCSQLYPTEFVKMFKTNN